ncbi:MAG: hypothetical protein ACP5RT_02795 [Candidatus Micrarchaeia archaeon]
MRFVYVAFVFAILILPFISKAMYLGVEGPVNGTLYNNGSIFLGKIGPGESFYVLASPSTTNTSGFYVNIGWDTLEAVKLPSGWYAQPSPLYENPMKIKITVAPNSSYGIYKIALRAVNIQNYSKLGNLTFYAYINVTPDVFVLSVSPKIAETGIGQPINLLVTINNTGISDDPFVINAYGLPAWNISDTVIALHGKTSRFIYPVFVNEPGVYDFNLSVGSATSSLIQKEYKIQLIGVASISNDYSSINEGVVLSPIVYEPAYAVMLFLREIYNYIK